MKALFLSRSQREKVLLVLFILVVLLIWGGNLMDRTRETSQDLSSTAQVLAEQQAWLDNATSIRLRMERTIENIDPEQTLGGTRLLAEIDAIARRHGHNPDIQTPRSQEGEVFNYHTSVAMVNRADIASLIAFTEEIKSRGPYMGMEELVITPDRNNPTLLDAHFRISSVELAP